MLLVVVVVVVIVVVVVVIVVVVIVVGVSRQLGQLQAIKLQAVRPNHSFNLRPLPRRAHS